MFCLLYRAPIFSLLSDPILFASVGPIIIGEREREKKEREERERKDLNIVNRYPQIDLHYRINQYHC